MGRYRSIIFALLAVLILPSIAMSARTIKWEISWDDTNELQPQTPKSNIVAFNIYYQKDGQISATTPRVRVPAVAGLIHYAVIAPDLVPLVTGQYQLGATAIAAMTQTQTVAVQPGQYPLTVNIEAESPMTTINKYIDMTAPSAPTGPTITYENSVLAKWAGMTDPLRIVPRPAGLGVRQLLITDKGGT